MRIVSRPRTTVTTRRPALRRALLRGRIAAAGAAGLGERGQGLLEYAIIAGIIIVGAVATLAALSGALNHMFTQITDTLSQY